MTPQSDQSTPYVFVSYASVDREKALHVADLLEAHGVSVWIDRQSIEGGSSWTSEIVRGIRSCAVLMILVSEAAARSRNVQQEVQVAWEHSRPVLPLLLERTALPESLEYSLAGRQWVEILDRPTNVWLPAALRALHGSGLTGNTPARPAPAVTHETVEPANAPPRATHTNLPAPPYPLVGRERELAALTELLTPASPVRLLTLTGPGGIGKTRLALQLAADVARSYADGVCFVSLGSTSDPRLVVPAIAQALNFHEASGEHLLERLVQWLSTKTVLLVLDNFEHLLPAATIVADLLAAAPLLRVVVTSRSALRLRGEREFAVPPLELPDPRRLALAGVHLASALGQYDAVRLFVARAGDVRPDFELTDENALAVAEICQRLDGLPLAIELAAARVRLLQPAALLTRLERRLPVLTGGARDLPARQQTLRNTIAWSYDLLPDDEKALFRRLGVFVGGGTIEATEAVYSPDIAVGIDALDGLESLVAQSLLRQEGGAEEEPRYRMLGTIWEYAGEQLLALGEADDARRRHANYYLGLAEKVRLGWGGPNQGEMRRRLEHDLQNLRAALRWAEGGGERALERQLIDVLGWFDRVLVEAFQGDAALDDYQRLLVSARATGDKREEVRALLGLVQSYYVLSLDDQTQTAIIKAKDYFEIGVALAREIGDTPSLIRLLVQSIWFRDSLPDYRQQSEANAREATILSEATGDEELMIEASMVGWTLFTRSEAERRDAELTGKLQARRDYVRLNRHYFSSMFRHLFWGQYARAIEISDAATKLATSLGIPPVQYATIKAWALLSLGRYEDAFQALQREVADEAHPFGRNHRDLGVAIYLHELYADERALATFREVEVRGARLKRAWMVSVARAGQSASLIRLGRLDEAAAIELGEELASAGWAFLPVVGAELARARGRFDEAIERAEAIVHKAEARGFTPAVLRARESQGRALIALGRLEEARTLVDAALPIARGIEARPLVWRLLATKATALAGLDQLTDAALAAVKACDVIQTIARTIDDAELRRGFLESPEVAAALRPPVAVQNTAGGGG